MGAALRLSGNLPKSFPFCLDGGLRSTWRAEGARPLDGRSFWEGIRFTVDWDWACLFNQTVTPAGKPRALKLVVGFQWNGEGIWEARPRRPASLIRRARRLPSTNDPATSPRARIHRVRRSPPPADVGAGGPSMNTAGLIDDASSETRIRLIEQMEGMLVFTPRIPATVATGRVRSHTASEGRCPISGPLLRAAKAVQGRASVLNRGQPLLHFGEGWAAYSVATAVVANAADRSAQDRFARECRPPSAWPNMRLRN